MAPDLHTLAATLRCPETEQPLEVLDDDRLAALNSRIRDGDATDEAGRPVERTLDAGLVRQDGRVVYPVRDGIPNLLISDRLALES